MSTLDNMVDLKIQVKLNIVERFSGIRNFERPQAIVESDPWQFVYSE